MNHAAVTTIRAISGKGNRLSATSAATRVSNTHDSLATSNPSNAHPELLLIQPNQDQSA